MNVVVGCPVRDRAWAFREWTECVRVAFDVVGLEPIWAFHIGVDMNGEDDGTAAMARGLVEREGGLYTISQEVEIPRERKPWTAEHYQNIVTYRNDLLGLVRQIQPNYFLSVDSDILLHPAALCLLMDSISVCGHRAFDAVAGKVYLGHSSDIVSYAFHHPNGGLRRQDQDGVFEVEIIMALKLMNQRAYNVDYSYSKFGEDIGWSDNCRAEGLKLGFDGRIPSKHLMTPDKIFKTDPRVGW